MTILWILVVWLGSAVLLAMFLCVAAKRLNGRNDKGPRRRTL